MGPRPILKPRCAHCRKRKIKCDFQRPACSTCRRGNKKCVYEQELTIVSYNQSPSTEPQIIQVAPFSETKSTKPRRSKVSLRPNSPDDDKEKLVHRPKLRQYEWHQEEFSSTAMKRSCSNATGIVVQAAYRDKLQDKFKEHYLPAGVTMWSALAIWMKPPEGGVYDEVITTAMQSLRLKVLGQETNNRDMMVKSMHMDGRTFRELRQQLMKATSVEDTKRAFRICFMLVASDACMMGTAHRLSKDGQGSHAWRYHLPGLESIMLSLGADAFASDDLYNMFPLTRAAMLGWALCDERPTFLSKPEWKTAPYVGHVKLPWQSLVDILFDVPELMITIRELAVVSDSSTFEGLMDQFVDSHKRLTDQLERWRKSYGKALNLDDILAADLTQIGSERNLSSMGQCINVLYYYLVVLCYYDLAYRVSRSGLFISNRHQAYFDKLEGLADVTRVAESIATCLSYCGRMSLGVAVKTFVCIPLTVVYRFLHRHSLSVSLWKLQQIVDSYMQNDLILLSDFADLAISPPIGSRRASPSCASSASPESYRDDSPPTTTRRSLL